jgi:hypothetical protein
MVQTTVHRRLDRFRYPSLSLISSLETIYAIKTLVSIFLKTNEIMKNTHLEPKRRVWRRLGPFSSSLPSLSRISSLVRSLQSIYTIIISYYQKN